MPVSDLVPDLEIQSSIGNALSQDSIGDRVAAVKQSIPESVKLIAVSKYASIEQMREAYEAGIRDFGESRVQDAIAKQESLRDLPDLTWHMIGSLQSNKARLAVQSFNWIHSVDRLSLAQQLNRLVKQKNVESSGNFKPLYTCLQVKLAHDPSKSGWYEQELMTDLPELQKCQNLNIVGMMTILPTGLNQTQAYELFAKTAALAEKLRNLGFKQLDHLSMGMSADYHIAIAAGATLIRIGTKLFSVRHE